jgi:hypothetical protein
VEERLILKARHGTPKDQFFLGVHLLKVHHDYLAAILWLSRAAPFLDTYYVWRVLGRGLLKAFTETGDLEHLSRAQAAYLSCLRLARQETTRSIYITYEIPRILLELGQVYEAHGSLQGAQEIYSHLHRATPRQLLGRDRYMLTFRQCVVKWALGRTITEAGSRLPIMRSCLDDLDEIIGVASSHECIRPSQDLLELSLLLACIICQEEGRHTTFDLVAAISSLRHGLGITPFDLNDDDAVRWFSAPESTFFLGKECLAHTEPLLASYFFEETGVSFGQAQLRPLSRLWAAPNSQTHRIVSVKKKEEERSTSKADFVLNFGSNAAEPVPPLQDGQRRMGSAPLEQQQQNQHGQHGDDHHHQIEVRKETGSADFVSNFGSSAAEPDGQHRMDSATLEREQHQHGYHHHHHHYLIEVQEETSSAAPKEVRDSPQDAWELALCRLQRRWRSRAWGKETIRRQLELALAPHISNFRREHFDPSARAQLALLAPRRYRPVFLCEMAAVRAIEDGVHGWLKRRWRHLRRLRAALGTLERTPWDARARQHLVLLSRSSLTPLKRDGATHNVIKSIAVEDAAAQLLQKFWLRAKRRASLWQMMRRMTAAARSEMEGRSLASHQVHLRWRCIWAICRCVGLALIARRKVVAAAVIRRAWQCSCSRVEGRKRRDQHLREMEALHILDQRRKYALKIIIAWWRGAAVSALAYRKWKSASLVQMKWRQWSTLRKEKQKGIARRREVMSTRIQLAWKAWRYREQARGRAHALQNARVRTACRTAKLYGHLVGEGDGCVQLGGADKWTLRDLQHARSVVATETACRTRAPSHGSRCGLPLLASVLPHPLCKVRTLVLWGIRNMPGLGEILCTSLASNRLTALLIGGCELGGSEEWAAFVETLEGGAAPSLQELVIESPGPHFGGDRSGAALAAALLSDSLRCGFGGGGLRTLALVRCEMGDVTASAIATGLLSGKKG